MSCAVFASIVGASVLLNGLDPRVSDKFVLAPVNAYETVLCYENHNPPKSRYGSWRMETEGVSVLIHVDWSSGTREHIQISAPDGYVVYPDRSAVVDDGESFTFYIMRAAS